jgi:hypothetical protein
MTSLKNLTSHAITVFAADGKTLIITVPPSGELARVGISRVDIGVPIEGIPVYVGTYGAVTGLPAIALGTIYLVSAMVRQAVPSRRDVLSPGELIRNADGQPIGCRGLEANP